MIGPDHIPALPRGVRTHHDRVRGAEVLLGPERVLMLDQIGVAVLTRVNGTATVADIVSDLAAAYDAPREMIEADVLAYLDDLADKRLLDVVDG